MQASTSFVARGARSSVAPRFNRSAMPPPRSSSTGSVNVSRQYRSLSTVTLRQQQQQQQQQCVRLEMSLPAATVRTRAFHATVAATSTPAPKHGEYTMIKVSADEAKHVGIITLDRPKALNALCNTLVSEVCAALKVFDHDGNTGCIILTGMEKAFAAGADIKEMAPTTYAQNYQNDLFGEVGTAFRQTQTPIIAAVSGYALGGGCELAMLCDIIIAAENAQFGQPEITLATIPGIGGTQRLTRAIGKSKAMSLVLTGDKIDAKWAESAGLVTKVVPTEKLMEEALAHAAKIASFSRPVARMAKEAVNKAYETTLQEGLLSERRLFHGTFALEDQKEGMSAFVEKRKPTWKHK